MTVFDDRRCELGEGSLWHPERKQLFWFDILGGALLSQAADEPLRWDFGEFASAAGWIDSDHLLVATETGLWRLAIETGARELVAPLAADAPHLRSNDGRADPWGGFWIGLMGKKAEDGAGGIWRLWRGELRQLIPGITIPNAICFDAGRELAYFADTRLGRVWAQPLAPGTGWPLGEPRLYLDLGREGFAPDGAVVDAVGRLWNAQWGASRVACYDAAGRFLFEVRFEASRVSCPAFGGDDLATLFVTTAQEGMSPAEREAEPGAGMTFARTVAAHGLPEPPVVLG
jgi:sugar lactone lactonase YvrE